MVFDLETFFVVFWSEFSELQSKKCSTFFLMNSVFNGWVKSDLPSFAGEETEEHVRLQIGRNLRFTLRIFRLIRNQDLQTPAPLTKVQWNQRTQPQNCTIISFQESSKTINCSNKCQTKRRHTIQQKITAKKSLSCIIKKMVSFIQQKNFINIKFIQKKATYSFEWMYWQRAFECHKVLLINDFPTDLLLRF